MFALVEVVPLEDDALVGFAPPDTPDVLVEVVKEPKEPVLGVDELLEPLD